MVFNPFPRRHLEPYPSECGRLGGGGGRGSKVVFEEMPRVLKILLGGSKMAGLPKIWIKGLKQSRAGVTDITHG